MKPQSRRTWSTSGEKRCLQRQLTGPLLCRPRNSDHEARRATPKEVGQPKEAHRVRPRKRGPRRTLGRDQLMSVSGQSLTNRLTFSNVRKPAGSRHGIAGFMGFEPSTGSSLTTYNNVIAGVPASFGIAVRGAAMCHPAACNSRRDCGVVA